MSSPPRRDSLFSRRLVAGLGVALVLLGLPHGSAAAGKETFVVVASADVPVSNLSVEQVRRLFLFREKFWKSGRPVRILLSEEGFQNGSILLEEIYRMDLGALRVMILEKLYQDEIDLPPKIVSSDKVAVSFVEAGQGLVTLVRAEAARGTKAKILSIGGFAPGADRYPFRR